MQTPGFGVPTGADSNRLVAWLRADSLLTSVFRGAMLVGQVCPEVHSMLLPRVAMVASALAVLLQAGCGGRTTRPAVTDVGLSLNISPAVGTPSLPVVADAR